MVWTNNAGRRFEEPVIHGNPTSNAARRTSVPVTAGVLAILAGMMGATFGVMALVLRQLFIVRTLDALAVPMIVLAVIAMVGGACAVRRRTWPLAFTGAICALMVPFTVLGIASLIFLLVGKSEFATKARRFELTQ